MSNSIIFMTAGAAIAAGGAVEYVPGTVKVIPSAGINPIVGVALGKATVDGDLIPVMVHLGVGASSGVLQQVYVEATLAGNKRGAKCLSPALRARKSA